MIKIKINAKGLLTTKERFKELAKDVFKDKELLAETASMAIKLIRFRTRLGEMPDGSKIKELEGFTVRKRKELAENGENKTNPSYKAEKSNLTFTGELMNSLTSKVNTGKGTFSLFFDGDHEPYKSVEIITHKNKNGSETKEKKIFKEGKTQSNNDIFKKLKKGGRDILEFNPDETVLNRVNTLAKAALRRRLSQFRKK